MTRESDGKTYLTTEEVKLHPDLGWSRDSLYRLKRAGVLTPKRFFGEHKTYWSLDELMAVKFKPFNVGELSNRKG